MTKKVTRTVRRENSSTKKVTKSQPPRKGPGRGGGKKNLGCGGMERHRKDLLAVAKGAHSDMVAPAAVASRQVAEVLDAGSPLDGNGYKMPFISIHAPPTPGTLANPNSVPGYKCSLHAESKVAHTLARIVAELRNPGASTAFVVPLREVISSAFSVDLLLEVFHYVAVEQSDCSISLDTGRSPRNPAHALLPLLSDSAMSDLVRAIVHRKSAWAEHPILSAMCDLWVSLQTSPVNWDATSSGANTLLLNLDLGYNIGGTRTEFDNHFRLMHATIASNPDVFDPSMSGTNLAIFTVDLRLLLGSLRPGEWRDGTKFLLDSLTSARGCLGGLLRHSVQQGVLQSTTSWEACLG